MKFKTLTKYLLPALALGAASYFPARTLLRMGKQDDGSYIVSTGQRILPGTIKFRGRPSDLAMHPSGSVFAILSQGKVLLCNEQGVIPDSEVKLDNAAGFHGIAWNPDGSRLFVSTGEKEGSGRVDGIVQSFSFDGQRLTKGAAIGITAEAEPPNPVPGGMCITRDGSRLYVCAADLNAVVEIDLVSNHRSRKFPVGMLPFDVKLSQDERSLVVSNWGGRRPKDGDLTARTGLSQIVIDPRGAPGSGTVSFVDLESGAAQSVEVGMHPSAIAVAGDAAYVCNTMSDSISELSMSTRRVTRTLQIQYGKLPIVGAMPDALAVANNKLYVSDGGDNAIAEMDLPTGRVIGYHPAGYFPIALALKGSTAIVLNSKGNGSVANTSYGRIGNVHDFEGTVSIIALDADLQSDTKIVAQNNMWESPVTRPKLAVYNGAIKHVVYIIKENRTYDEIYGDMPEGNGDAKLCDIGEQIMPNHRAIARHFTLFDNAYVSGTNSADGHAWSTQSLANDYLEHFYVGYSRTYPDDGDCAMSISNGGCIWDAAAKKHKSIRDYGEYCDEDLAEYKPYRPRDWFEAWKDREGGTNKFTYTAHTLVNGLKPYVAPHVHYWPLIQSDQSRADEYLKEYREQCKNGSVPDLTVLSLPCDHSEGADPTYPQPRCMMADNDLALGRVVEAITKGPEWKNTCIFVIEDDAQSGPDHVDGHRTSYLVISPYNKRHITDSHYYTTTNMLRSIEMMLGLDPMNRFDALSEPIDTCFQDTPDLTPFEHVPNNIALDMPNPGRGHTAMTQDERYWAMKTRSLDWSHIDGPDWYWLNRIVWFSLHHDKSPYPSRPGEKPGSTEVDD